THPRRDSSARGVSGSTAGRSGSESRSHPSTGTSFSGSGGSASAAESSTLSRTRLRVDRLASRSSSRVTRRVTIVRSLISSLMSPDEYSPKYISTTHMAVVAVRETSRGPVTVTLAIDIEDKSDGKYTSLARADELDALVEGLRKFGYDICIERTSHDTVALESRSAGFSK